MGLSTNNKKIILYMQGNTGDAKLSLFLETRMNRMIHTSNLITKYGEIKKVLPILCNRFGISHSNAKRLYRDSQEVFEHIKQTTS